MISRSGVRRRLSSASSPRAPSGAAPRSGGPVPPDPRRRAGGCDPRLRQPAFHSGARSRSARARVGGGPRRGGGDRRLVGNRRPPRRDDGARHWRGRRGHHQHVLVLCDRGVHRAPRRRPAAGRHRSRDLQSVAGGCPIGDLVPHQGDHPGPSLRSLCRHGSAVDDRRRGGCACHRGRVSGHRRDLSRAAGRIDGDGRLLFVLSEQEPRRIRRWRVGDDGGCVARPRGEAAQESRFGDEVLPPEGRGQLPAGCAAGGDPAREAAAPAGVDGDAARERSAVPPALRRGPDRPRPSCCRSSPRADFTSTTSSSSAFRDAIGCARF